MPLDYSRLIAKNTSECLLLHGTLLAVSFVYAEICKYRVRYTDISERKPIELAYFTLHGTFQYLKRASKAQSSSG